MGTKTGLRTCLLHLHCSTGDLNQVMIGLTTNYSLYVSGTGVYATCFAMRYHLHTCG